MVSVVVPAYNEAAGISDFLDDLLSLTNGDDRINEVIVVDDGSDDQTGDIVSEYAVTLISHEQNRGYGSALKTGIRAVDCEFVLIIDSDGTYPVEDIPDLIDRIDGNDMVVGARTGDEVEIPTYRQPAKWFLSRLSQFLVDTDIPDLNSGMRIFRREDAMDYFHILPSGFSFTTTITLAYLTSDRMVEYYSTNYYDRNGESKIQPIRDGFNFVALILRTLIYFNPLRVFVPMGIATLGLAFATFAYTALVLGNLLDVTTIILSVAGIQILFFGLLADLIVRRSKV